MRRIEINNLLVLLPILFLGCASTSIYTTFNEIESTTLDIPKDQYTIIWRIFTTNPAGDTILLFNQELTGLEFRTALTQISFQQSKGRWILGKPILPDRAVQPSGFFEGNPYYISNFKKGGWLFVSKIKLGESQVITFIEDNVKYLPYTFSGPLMDNMEEDESKVRITTFKGKATYVGDIKIVGRNSDDQFFLEEIKLEFDQKFKNYLKNKYEKYYYDNYEDYQELLKEVSEKKIKRKSLKKK